MRISSILTIFLLLISGMGFSQNSCSGSMDVTNLTDCINGRTTIGDGTTGYIKVCFKKGSGTLQCGGSCPGGQKCDLIKVENSGGSHIDYIADYDKGCVTVDVNDGYADLCMDECPGGSTGKITWTTVDGDGHEVCGGGCNNDSDCPGEATCTNSTCDFCATPGCSDNDCMANAKEIDYCGFSYQGSTDGYTNYGQYLGGLRSNLDCNTSTSPSGSDGEDVSYSIENDSWFKFCPQDTGTWEVTFEVDTNYENDNGAQLAIFQGHLGNLHTRFDQYSNKGNEGATYTTSFSITDTSDCVYMNVDGYAGDQGDYTLSVQCTSCPSGCALDVALSSFNAKKIDEGVRLNWSVASENKHDYYVVQRSQNSEEYSSLQTIPATSGDAYSKRYKYIDRSPHKEDNYYRLKMVAPDGSISYSKVIGLDNSGGVNQDRIDISQLSTIENKGYLNINARSAGKGVVKIFDVTGSTVYSKQVSLVRGNNHIQLHSLHDLSRGMYVIAVRKNNRVVRKKFVK